MLVPTVVEKAVQAFDPFLEIKHDDDKITQVAIVTQMDAAADGVKVVDGLAHPPLIDPLPYGIIGIVERAFITKERASA